MKEINKLVDLVTHGLKSNFGVIDLKGQVKNPGKEQQLYNGVLKGQFPDDEITAKGMYNSNIYDQRFRMLKSRLRYKLYDLLHHIDFELPHYSFSVQKRLECQGYLHKARILFELGDMAMAEKQYNKVLVLGGECQFTPELVEANEIKRSVLAKEFKPTDFELTIEELQKLRKQLAIEREAEDLFLRMELLLSKSIHSRNINGEEASNVIIQLEKLYQETKSYDIFEYIYRLNVWVYSINSDFTGLVDYLIKAQKEAANIAVNPLRFDMAFNQLELAKAYLTLADFKKGAQQVEAALKEVDKSTDMWFKLAEVEFLLMMHDHKYKEANKVLNGVLKNPNFNRADLTIINRWKILKIYLNFAAPQLGIQKRIRFYDIYESADAYFNEMKGYKISLQLLEFMHLVNKGTMDLADKKLDDLESYFYKHLNDPGKNQREKQLLKMIKFLRSTRYDVEETRTKTAAYFEKMSAKKTINAFADFEIVPYEDLWLVLLDVVSQNAKVAG